jgi:predicted nucleic acid-binding protein
VKIVVDTSVIIAVITNETHRTSLINKTIGAQLVAPDSLKCEIGNAFSAMFKRNRITLEQALIAVEAFNKIHIQYFDTHLAKAIEISHGLNIYAYDAYFLECALANKCPLLSLDLGLCEAAAKLNIKSIEV